MYTQSEADVFAEVGFLCEQDSVTDPDRAWREGMNVLAWFFAFEVIACEANNI